MEHQLTQRNWEDELGFDGNQLRSETSEHDYDDDCDHCDDDYDDFDDDYVVIVMMMAWNLQTK